MANTLTNLIPTIVKGFDVVSRELVGFIPGCNRDPSTDRIAKNQTLYSWRTPTASLSDIAPLNVSPLPSDKSLSSVSITVSNYKYSDFYFTGEEEKALASGGNGNYGNIVTDMVEQCIRAIVNQMESDIASAAAAGGSRAYGTAATLPFLNSTTGMGGLGESAQVRRILDDNGAPSGARSLVVDTAVGAQLRTVYQLTRANEAGGTMTLRDGELLNLHGFSVKESAQIAQPTAGTASGATTDSTGYAVGDTVLTLASAGSGTILAGDVITIAGQTDRAGALHKFVVAATTVTNTSGGGTITLAQPGLLKAITTATKAITVVATTNRNIAFSRNAILLATRLPARPSGGDMASDVQVVTDPRSGISLEISMYPQYRQVRYEIAAAWGVKVVKPEHIAELIW